MSYNGIKGSSLSLRPVCFSPSINSKSVESWGWRAWTNAGSPGPFEIGSAERRNHTDKLLAAISWERMKRGDFGRGQHILGNCESTGESGAEK